MKRIFISLVFLALFAQACKEDSSTTTPTPVDETVSFKLQLRGTFGDAPFALNQPFTTVSGDAVRFTMAKFYISEICLVDTLGRAIPVSNHTISLLDYANAQNGTLELTLRAKPGLYRGMKFNIAVPFDLNHRDASTQPPPLNVDSGMFWTWNTGYIFHRLEGTFDSSGVSRNFLYHIGGDNRNLTVQLARLVTQGGQPPTEFVVNENGSSVFTARMDYSRVFTTGLTPPNPINLRQNMNERSAHGGALADRVFINTQTMFSRITN